MGSYRQTFLDNFPTLMTFLRGVPWVHSSHLMTSSCSLVTQNIEECAPRGVENALRQLVIFDHVRDLKVFYSNDLIAVSVLFGCLEMVITALSVDLQMGFRNISGGFLASMTALLATTKCALLASKCPLRGAIEPWIFDGVAFTIGKEDFQAHVNANSRMLTGRRVMFNMMVCLTDDQGIPMCICSVNQMHRLRGSFYRAVQFDLEEMSDLLWDNEVFLVLMQVTILAVLSQLDGMPAVRLLEARKPDTRNVIFLGSKIAFERFRETISKHLDGGSRDMFALSLKGRFQIILARERPVLLILCFDGLKHAIVNGARLTQALHELEMLFLRHEKSVLKGLHANILLETIRIVNRQGKPNPSPKKGTAQFIPRAEARGTLAPNRR